MVKNNLARLQTICSAMLHCAYKIVDIRWVDMAPLGRARLANWGARSFDNAELNRLTRLRTSTPGEP
jgi:hypothetical protein